MSNSELLQEKQTFYRPFQEIFNSCFFTQMRAISFKDDEKELLKTKKEGSGAASPTCLEKFKKARREKHNANIRKKLNIEKVKRKKLLPLVKRLSFEKTLL